MSAIVHLTPQSAVAMGTDSDPNSVEPSGLRTFIPPVGRDSRLGGQCGVYVVPLGGSTVTLQLWGYDRTLGRWFKIGAPAACATDWATTVAVCPIGIEKVTLQVTANTGVLRIGAGFDTGYMVGT